MANVCAREVRISSSIVQTGLSFSGFGIASGGSVMRVKFLSPRSPDGRLSLGSCSAAIATTSSTSSSCLGWCPGGGSRGGVSCKATSVTGAMSGRDVSTKQHGLGGTEGEMDETIEKPEQQPQQRQQQFLEFPKQLAKQILRYGDDAPIEPPMVKVRLKVHYRCFNRQMLCIGGSNIPFGWSFLSIAKVPMSWTDGDVWVTEVEVPLGTRLEYKYVILEEQDWTKQENEDAEGVVTTFRVAPGEVPDVKSITKKMAIVAWQPGPNRMLVVPKKDEYDGMVPGEVREREPGPSRQERTSLASPRQIPRNDVVYGSREEIRLEEDSTLVLDRTDVWGYGDWITRVGSQSQGPPNPRSRFGG